MAMMFWIGLAIGFVIGVILGWYGMIVLIVQLTFWTFVHWVRRLIKR